MLLTERVSGTYLLAFGQSLDRQQQVEERLDRLEEGRDAVALIAVKVGLVEEFTQLNDEERARRRGIDVIASAKERVEVADRSGFENVELAVQLRMGAKVRNGR